MSDPARDDAAGGGPAAPEPGERPADGVVAEWRADRRTYWRDAEGLAGMCALVVVVALYAIGSPHVLIGGVGAAAAVMARAFFLRPGVPGPRWRMTDRMLFGPGGRAIALDEIATVRKMFGDVQVVTKSGDRHLMKHLARAKQVATEIELARVGRKVRAAEEEDGA